MGGFKITGPNYVFKNIDTYDETGNVEGCFCEGLNETINENDEKILLNNPSKDLKDVIGKVDYSIHLNFHTFTTKYIIYDKQQYKEKMDKIRREFGLNVGSDEVDNTN